MKKIVLGVVAIVMVTLSAASMSRMSYECWTYINGKPDKMIHILADNREEAESLAPAKFRDLGDKWDYIQCH